MSRKIGLFGGSFDPIHEGHLSIIEGAIESGLVDDVIVIPTVRNSFKRGRVISPAPYRFFMTKAVLDEMLEKNKSVYKHVFLSDIEFSIEGISYTLNTVKELKKGKNIKKLTDISGDYKLFWLCGSDILESFDKWYKPEELLEEVSLAVARRPGADSAFDSNIERLEAMYDTKIYSFEIEGLQVSSSEIRKENAYENVPESAIKFITTNNVYDRRYLDYVTDDTVNAFYEDAIALYGYLGEKRLLHTMNVACLSALYAGIHGIDADKALIAGVLHDCAKELEDDKQREMALSVADESFDNKKLWHGPAGVVMAKEVFAISDKEILDSIMYHTTGRGNPTELDKIVYLADKVEPARDYADLNEIRITALKDIDRAVCMCFDQVFEKFRKTNRELHPLSLECYKQLGDNISK